MEEMALLMNAITHGISISTAAGFTRVAMMYLYTVSNIK